MSVYFGHKTQHGTFWKEYKIIFCSYFPNKTFIEIYNLSSKINPYENHFSDWRFSVISVTVFRFWRRSECAWWLHAKGNANRHVVAAFGCRWRRRHGVTDLHSPLGQTQGVPAGKLPSMSHFHIWMSPGLIAAKVFALVFYAVPYFCTRPRQGPSIDD